MGLHSHKQLQLASLCNEREQGGQPLSMHVVLTCRLSRQAAPSSTVSAPL